MKIKKFFILALATIGGVGFFPFASGTVASVVAILPYYALRQHLMWYVPVLLVITFIGIWVSGEAETYLNEKDPHPVVIDEVAGYLVAAMFLPFHWFYPLAAFFLFRLFDVWKPTPINQLQDLPKGWGIMVDDLLAGLYANIILQIARLILPF